MKKKFVFKRGKIYWILYGECIYKTKFTIHNCRSYRFTVTEDSPEKGIDVCLNVRMIDKCVFKTEKEARKYRKDSWDWFNQQN